MNHFSNFFHIPFMIWTIFMLTLLFLVFLHLFYCRHIFYKIRFIYNEFIIFLWFCKASLILMMIKSISLFITRFIILNVFNQYVLARIRMIFNIADFIKMISFINDGIKRSWLRCIVKLINNLNQVFLIIIHSILFFVLLGFFCIFIILTI